MSSQLFRATLASPIGNLRIEIQANRLTKLEFLADAMPTEDETPHPLYQHVRQALENYFASSQQAIDVPFTFDGTPFQQKVWRALCDIPPGETLTYGELAAKLGTGPRAVGNACRHNPLPLVIPCHRVVGKQGFGGFAGKNGGELLAIKKWLLTHEQTN